MSLCLNFASLQADLAVASENATLLKDLMQTMESPADGGADSIVTSLVQRCRVLQSGVQKVIQKIQDESVMAAALQVCFTATSVLDIRPFPTICRQPCRALSIFL